jgi:hypothetical protein
LNGTPFKSQERKRSSGKLVDVKTLAWRTFVATSLLLLIGTAIVWSRAQWVQDQFERAWVVKREATATVYRWYQVRLARESLAVSLATMDLSPADATPPDAIFFGTIPDAGGFRFISDTFRGPLAPGSFSRLGFGWHRYHWPVRPSAAYFLHGDRTRGTLQTLQSAREFELAVPWWFLGISFALAPARALWTWHKSRRHRRPPPACRTCGYDLRATADATGPLLPTCPECGAVPEKPAREPD